MNADTSLTLGGAAIAIFIAMSVLFQRDESRGRTEKLFRLAGRFAFVAGATGWVLMWLTEEEIWSPAPRTCSEFASIELKGHVYRNCSYLVHRYQSGEWLFYAGLAVFAGCIILDRIAHRRG